MYSMYNNSLHQLKKKEPCVFHCLRFSVELAIICMQLTLDVLESIETPTAIVQRLNNKFHASTIDSGQHVLYDILEYSEIMIVLCRQKRRLCISIYFFIISMYLNSS